MLFLKDKLAAKTPAYACWAAFRDPQVASALAEQPFDVIVLDSQHGFHDETSALACIPPVLNAGKTPLFRIPPGRWDLCERVLDFGALGVIAPMINSRTDAEAFAEATKYPKIGSRSHGPRYAANLLGMETSEYLINANDFTVSLAQVETRESYDNLDDILGVEGIDGILMGPADFSITVTGKPVPDPYGPETVDLVKDIAERTLAAGKIPAAFTASAEHAKLVASFGYSLISVAMDSSLLATGAKTVFSALD